MLIISHNLLFRLHVKQSLIHGHTLSVADKTNQWNLIYRVLLVVMHPHMGELVIHPLYGEVAGWLQYKSGSMLWHSASFF